MTHVFPLLLALGQEPGHAREHDGGERVPGQQGARPVVLEEEHDARPVRLGRVLLERGRRERSDVRRRPERLEAGRRRLGRLDDRHLRVEPRRDDGF